MYFESKLSVGQIIGERYRIIRGIASGGMSQVYLAEDLRLIGKRWAIKESKCSEQLDTDIQAEAELLISLNHPRLPRIVDFYLPDNGGYSYLIMDYIEGMTLSNYMERYPSPIPAEMILRTAKQILEVLQYLHGHQPPIIYRDLKPSNIMLTPHNELILIDFGIARSYRKGGGEDTVNLGTVGFAAPEQYGNEQSGPVSDLYGLGALLLYMATGGQCSYWQPGMENRVGEHIPNRLIPILRRLLRHHPEERYQTADKVLQALADIEIEFDVKATAVNLSRKSAKNNETTVVALLGVAQGLGTTHTSLMISSYLSQIGSTAWVDFCPNSSVFNRLSSLLDSQVGDVPIAEDHSAFAWKGVHYWKRPANGSITTLVGSVYEFVVLDLGVGRGEGAVDEFIQSDVSLLIASGAEWRLEEILVWLSSCNMKLDTRLKVLLPLVDRTSAELLQVAIGGVEVYSLPLQSSPFQEMSERMKKVLNVVLSGVIDEKRPRGNRSFFRKKGRL